MKIRIRRLFISPECIIDVGGDEDANNLCEKVLLLGTLSSEISSATRGSVYHEWFIDMKDDLLAEIDGMADKHGIDKSTFRNKCLSSKDYFSGKEYGE